MDTLWQDLRYGIRMLFKNPFVTAVAVLSLALGIGANSTIFSLVNAVLLKPLPAERPDRLVRLHSILPDGSRSLQISYPNYIDYRDQNQVFSGLVAVSLTAFTLGADGQTDQILGETVSGNYFTVLGIRAAPGRVFMPEEDRPGGHPVAVVSHGLWQRRFAADPALVGKIVDLNGDSFTVVGLASKEFTGTFAGAVVDVWVPMMQTSAMRGSGALTDRNKASLQAIGRLRDEVNMDQAQAGMSTLVRQIEQAYPDADKGGGITLVEATLLHGSLRSAASGFFGIVMALVALVLLIACANIANLLLARAMGRRREIATRLAMGASRFRIIRQFITESLIVTLLGGAVGILIATWVSALLMRFNPIPFVPLRFDLSVDSRVLLFTLLISLLIGLLLGLAPALQASKPDLVPALKDDSGTVCGSQRRSRLFSMFVIAQVAMSLALLFSAGLFLQSLRNASSLDPGFDPKNALAMDIDLDSKGLSNEQGLQFYRSLVERIRSLPEARSVTLANLAPLDIATQKRGVIIEGHEPPPGQPALRLSFNRVDIAYFQTLGIPLVSGRDFNDRDKAGSAGVVIINENMAKRFWPGVDPIGKQFVLASEAKQDAPEMRLEVIGVAKDVKYRTLGEEAQPHMYLPFLQHYDPSMALLVKTAGDPAAMIGTVQREVQKQDAEVQGFFARTLIQHMAFSLMPARLAAALLAVFGLLALLLATVGIYGTISYAVSQRTHEIGLRMALGAQRSDILKLILGHGLAMTLIGIAVGVGASFALARLLSSLLFGVSPTDPLTIAGVALLLSAVGLLACYIPARRATRIDPMVALRYE
jgi:putative ABC transport system permease protein